MRWGLDMTMQDVLACLGWNAGKEMVADES